jgi:cytochrome P450
MSLAVTVPQRAVTLNLLQQWRYFSEPVAMAEWIRAHYGDGDFVLTHFQGREYVIVVSAEGARQVFSADPDGYEVFWRESFSGLMGQESVWVLIQAKHRRERQRFAPAVHAHHFRSYGTVIRDIARLHIGKWQPGQTVKAIDTTLAIALDVIMRLVFGVEEEVSMQEGRKILKEFTDTIHPLIVFFPQFQRKWFPLWRRYDRIREEVFAWQSRLIAARRARGAKFAEVQDVLGVLLTARDEAGRPLDEDYIHSQLISILSAGHETTAVALGWALYELGRHPGVMAKLRAEVESVGPEADPGTILTLPYLSAVCNEAIRLHPILAECARVPMSPLEILGRSIPVGQALVVSIADIHHDPVVYPEPGRFRPERFIERTYSNAEFLPFGGGHRRCLGAGLAEYTLRLALAEIALRWEFEPARVDRDVRRNIAMGPRYGVPLRIKAERQPNWAGVNSTVRGELEYVHA